MKNRNLLKTGLIGTGVLAVCCFTPILVISLGVLGLSAFVGMLDIFLLPLLGIFVALTGYALWQRQKSKST